MLSSTSSRVAVALLGVAGLVAVAAYLTREKPKPPDKDEPPREEFRNVVAESGITFRMAFLPDEQGEKFKINLYDHGSGLAVADYDGDGHDDVYFVNQLGPNALYRNKGDGTFEDATRRAGVGLGDRICVGATFADIDNDGDQDLFVTSTRGGNTLFRNKGDGSFEDVTKAAGLTHTGHSQIGTFFDADGDGFLDLLLLQTAKWTTDALSTGGRHYVGKETFFQTAASEKEFNRFYRNNGDGTFADITTKSGLAGLGWAGDAAVFDFNDDGRPDVLVTNMFGRAQLYRNDGGGAFTDVTLATLGRTSWGGMGAWAFDFNNDGRLDLYMVDMHSDMWVGASTDPAVVKDRAKYPNLLGGLYRSAAQDGANEKAVADLVGFRPGEVLLGNTFFKNLGGGRFKEASDAAGLETFWPWGVAVGDYDNNGYQDVFQPAGMGYPFFFWPNYLLMNNGDETFTDRAGQLGVEPPGGPGQGEERIGGKPAVRSSRAAAAADFDGDGRLDLMVNNFNAVPHYFKNNLPRRNYVAWRLTGSKGNRDAVGATVTLYMGDEVMVRQVPAAGGYLAQSSRVLHFGLGNRAKVDRAEIRWPGGRAQTIAGPALNTLHRVTEPKE